MDSPFHFFLKEHTRNNKKKSTARTNVLQLYIFLQGGENYFLPIFLDPLREKHFAQRRRAGQLQAIL